MRRRNWVSIILFVLLGASNVKTQVTITVDAQQSRGKYKQFWGGLGQESFYDGVLSAQCRNYFNLIKATNSHGREVFNYFSTKCMFTDKITPYYEEIGGYVYIEDQNGNVTYNWEIVDSHFDAILGYGLIPIVNFTFMPEKLASDPSRRVPWSQSNVSPPKDYNKWRNLVYETVKHLKNRYGAAEIEKWFFEVWNEPDLDEFFWIPNPDQSRYPDRSDNIEFFKLYDYSVDGAIAAHPNIKIGGPSIAGDVELFILHWYPHCKSGTNYATGKVGTRVDFASRHHYGTAEWIYENLQKFGEYATTNGKPLLGDDPIILITENGPTPALNDWLNSRYVAAWLVNEVDMIFNVADNYGYNYIPDVILFWSLPLPRNFGKHFGVATVMGDNVIIKRPVYNGFDALGYLSDERIALTGAKYGDAVHGIATKNEDQSIEVILYHFNGDDVWNEQTGQSTVNLSIKNIPFHKGYVQYFKIDETHSNAYSIWQSMGSPDDPTSNQLQALQSQDDLQLCEPMSQVSISGGTLTKQITLQNNSVVLVVVSAQNPLTNDTTPPNPPTGLKVTKP